MRALLPHAHELRVRCLATLPMVGVAGAALGAAIARSAGSPMGDTILWFTVAMCVASYVSAMLEGATLASLHIDTQGVNADVVGFLWDGVLGAGTGILLSRITSVDTLQAAGAASAILFVQRLILEKFLIGNFIGESFAAVLQGGGVRREPDYSRAAALAMRGDYAGARREYESAILGDTYNPRPYIALARMLRDDARDYNAATDVFEDALRATRSDARTTELITREVAELYMHRLDKPGRAATVLARFLAAHETEWARAMLRQAKAESS